MISYPKTSHHPKKTNYSLGAQYSTLRLYNQKCEAYVNASQIYNRTELFYHPLLPVNFPGSMSPISSVLPKAITNSIKQTKSKRSTGLHKVPTITLKKCAATNRPFQCSPISHFVLNSHFPAYWKFPQITTVPEKRKILSSLLLDYFYFLNLLQNLKGDHQIDH